MLFLYIPYYITGPREQTFLAKDQFAWTKYQKLHLIKDDAFLNPDNHEECRLRTSLAFRRAKKLKADF